MTFRKKDSKKDYICNHIQVRFLLFMGLHNFADNTEDKIDNDDGCRA